MYSTLGSEVASFSVTSAARPPTLLSSFWKDRTSSAHQPGQPQELWDLVSKLPLSSLGPSGAQPLNRLVPTLLLLNASHAALAGLGWAGDRVTAGVLAKLLNRGRCLSRVGAGEKVATRTLRRCPPARRGRGALRSLLSALVRLSRRMNLQGVWLLFCLLAVGGRPWCPHLVGEMCSKGHTAPSEITKVESEHTHLKAPLLGAVRWGVCLDGTRDPSVVQLLPPPSAWAGLSLS